MRAYEKAASSINSLLFYWLLNNLLEQSPSRPDGFCPLALSEGLTWGRRKCHAHCCRLLHANGIDGEKGDRAKLGLGGIQTVNASGGIRFVGFPLVEKKSRSEYGYGETMPAYGSVGFDLGLYFGIGARVDVFEFFDFLLGFAEVDIVKDDEEEPVEYLPRVEP